jgi:hypothetical protein
MVQSALTKSGRPSSTTSTRDLPEQRERREPVRIGAQVSAEGGFLATYSLVLAGNDYLANYAAVTRRSACRRASTTMFVEDDSVAERSTCGRLDQDTDDRGVQGRWRRCSAGSRHDFHRVSEAARRSI